MLPEYKECPLPGNPCGWFGEAQMCRAVRAFAAMLALATAATSACADSVADFYRGRSVTLAIGYSAAGGYDTYARVLARHLGDHIPGRPTILPQNMEGAGSLRAANWLYAAAPRDGSVIGMVSRGMAMEPLIGRSHASFDSRKLTWLGSGTNEV